MNQILLIMTEVVLSMLHPKLWLCLKGNVTITLTCLATDTCSCWFVRFVVNLPRAFAPL